MFSLSRQNKRLGIYVHVPFCAKKCAYCDFYSYAPRDERVFSAYVDALLTHMKSYRTVGADYAPDTVYIGGGTPTVMPSDEMMRLIHGIKSSFRLMKNAEFTMECNPATADFDTLRRYRRAGVNRPPVREHGGAVCARQGAFAPPVRLDVPRRPPRRI